MDYAIYVIMIIILKRFPLSILILYQKFIIYCDHLINADWTPPTLVLLRKSSASCLADGLPVISYVFCYVSSLSNKLPAFLKIYCFAWSSS